jgi:hypothetical protein
MDEYEHRDRDMEDDTWAEDESSVSESESDESDSDGKSEVETTWTAESRWANSPSKEAVRRLVDCVGLEDNVLDGWSSDLTARDVILNAVASVRFLERVGSSAIHPDSIGIDSDGRLCKVPTHNAIWHTDYRAEFCEVISTLQKNQRQAPTKEKIRGLMKAYLNLEDDDFFEDTTGDETSGLRSLIRALVLKQDFGVLDLKPVLAECKAAAKRMDSAVLLVNAVRQDLIDTGSTSLSRWERVKGMDWPLWGVPALLTCENAKTDVETMADNLSTYQTVLGLTMKLKADLVVAIDKLA